MMKRVSSHDILSLTLTITEHSVYLGDYSVLKATENVTENNFKFISNNFFISVGIFTNKEYRKQTYIIYSLRLFFGSNFCKFNNIVQLRLIVLRKKILGHFLLPAQKY